MWVESTQFKLLMPIPATDIQICGLDYTIVEPNLVSFWALNSIQFFQVDRPRPLYCKLEINLYLLDMYWICTIAQYLYKLMKNIKI